MSKSDFDVGPWLRTTAFMRQKNRHERNKGMRALENRKEAG